MKAIVLLVSLLAMAGCAVETSTAATPEDDEEETSVALAGALLTTGTAPHLTHLTTERGPAVDSATPSGAQNCAACGPGPQPWNGGVVGNVARR